MPRTFQKTPIGIVKRLDEKFALARVFGIAGRFIVHK